LAADVDRTPSIDASAFRADNRIVVHVDFAAVRRDAANVTVADVAEDRARVHIDHHRAVEEPRLAGVARDRVDVEQVPIERRQVRIVHHRPGRGGQHVSRAGLDGNGQFVRPRRQRDYRNTIDPGRVDLAKLHHIGVWTSRGRSKRLAVRRSYR